jgi:hypothetical protein
MIYMATTKIPVEQTAGEIMALLAKHDVQKMTLDYDTGGLSGLIFYIRHKDKNENTMLLPFRMPVRWQPTLKAMTDDRKTPAYLCTEDQARRVAWRMSLRWLEGQVAFVDTGQADMKEIMLPYLIVEEKESSSRTLYEVMARRNFPALKPGSDLEIIDV